MTPQQKKAQKLLALIENCKDPQWITPVPRKVIIEVLDYLMGEYRDLEDRYNGVLRALNARPEGEDCDQKTT